MDEEMVWSGLENITSSGVPTETPDWIGERLLGEIVDDLEWFCTVAFDPRVHTQDHHPLILFHQGVPYRPVVWFGEMDICHRQRYSRACQALERDGYLIRNTEPLRNRVMSQQPTLYGLTWPLHDAPLARRQAVIEGLRRTKWGRELAELLLTEMSSGRRVQAGP